MKIKVMFSYLQYITSYLLLKKSFKYEARIF